MKNIINLSNTFVTFTVIILTSISYYYYNEIKYFNDILAVILAPSISCIGVAIGVVYVNNADDTVLNFGPEYYFNSLNKNLSREDIVSDIAMTVFVAYLNNGLLNMSLCVSVITGLFIDFSIPSVISLFSIYILAGYILRNNKPSINKNYILYHGLKKDLNTRIDSIEAANT